MFTNVLLIFLENPPLVQLNPPQDDFNFVLKSDEGICELFDVQCS